MEQRTLQMGQPLSWLERGGLGIAIVLLSFNKVGLGLI